MSLHFVGYVARGNVKKMIGKKKEEYVALSKLELMLELSHKGQLSSIALWALVRDSCYRIRILVFQLKLSC